MWEGNQHNGMWKDGKRHGQGETYEFGGMSYTGYFNGIWENGNLVLGKLEAWDDTHFSDEEWALGGYIFTGTFFDGIEPLDGLIELPDGNLLRLKDGKIQK